jgi:hypothetical protein
MTERAVTQNPLVQGVDETIAYTITTTPWGTAPTSVAVKAYKMTSPDVYTDVTSTVLSGTATVSGDIITLPALTALTLDNPYRVETKFTCSGNVFECYFVVTAER